MSDDDHEERIRGLEKDRRTTAELLGLLVKMLTKHQHVKDETLQVVTFVPEPMDAEAAWKAALERLGK